LQETKNYELSRTVRQTKKPDAQLQRLYVAVVVDQKVDENGKPAARTKEEIAELTALARQAAGIDDTRGDKIEVRSIRFAGDEEPTVAAAPVPWTAALPLPLPILVGGGAGVLLLLATVAYFVFRKKKPAAAPARMSLALPAPVADLERVLDARGANAAAGLPGSPDVPALPPGRPVRDRVLAAVRSDVERTAEVLTAWLSEPPVAAKPQGAAK
jgi:flagellar biosynthesis/type III secretory pathway M-ring protein FliF/YscJ